MVHRPTLRQLDYLLALEQVKNFTDAADQCNVTQSTLSAGISELEASLGLTLVERDKRFIGLTHEGEEIANRAREVLALTDDMVGFATRLQAPLSGRVSLGAIPTIGPFLLPQLASLLHEGYPNLNLDLIEGKSDEQVSWLQSGKIDVSLLAFPYPTKGLEIEIIKTDPMYLLVAKDSPFAKRKHIKSDELVGEELLLLADGHCLRDHALGVCKLPGIARPDGFEGTSLLTLALMVEMGRGYTLIPEMAVKSNINWGEGVKAIPFGNENEGRQIGLAWRKSSPRGDEFRLLVKEIKALLD
jgi:LysR family hydrogen peroxide-inducible transcriptional activator